MCDDCECFINRTCVGGCCVPTWTCCDDYCCHTGHPCWDCVGGDCKLCDDHPYRKCCGQDGCYDIRTHGCCDSKKIYNKSTQKCCDDGNGSVCDKDEICCDDGSCCDKVWTKETHTAINDSCPSVADCYEPGVGCDGTKVKDQQSYDSCLNVGVGLGEHCECNETLQVVGTKHTCQEDWDWSLMLSCAAQCVCCAVQCSGAYADPASCSDCLAGLELDCCGGDTCHICDFLESCEPLYPEEIKDNVFINFGDCP